MAEAALLPSFLDPLRGQHSRPEISFGRVHRRYDADPAASPQNFEAEAHIGERRVWGNADRLDLSNGGRTARIIYWKTGRAPCEMPIRRSACRGARAVCRHRGSCRVAQDRQGGQGPAAAAGGRGATELGPAVG